MSKTKKIASNTIISTTARVISLGLALIIVALMTRHLQKGGYGNYTTVIAYLTTFTALANLGLYNLLLRDISRKGADEVEIASNIFTFRLASLALITPVAIGIAFLLPYGFEVKIGIAITGVSAVLLSLNQVLMPIFQKYLQMIKVAIAEVLSRAAQLGLVFLGVKLNYGLLYFLAILVGANFLGFAIQFFYARRLVPFRLKVDIPKWKSILKKALPIGIGVIFTIIYFKVDTVMLSLIKEPEAVGIYGLSYKVLENLIFFPAMFVGLVTPLLSKYAFQKRDDFKRVFQKALDFIIIVLVPACTGIILLALPIVQILGGEGFRASAQVLRILSVAIGLIFLASIFGNSAIVLKKQVQSAWAHFAGAVLNVGANLYFIPKFSYFGAATTTVITELLVTILLFFIIKRAYNWQPNFSMFVRTIGAVLPMAAYLYYFQGWNLAVNIAIGALIYFVFLYLFGGISKEDIKTLISLREKSKQAA